MRGVLDVCAIKPPGFGERRRAYLEDIAVVTGATFVTEQLGLRCAQTGHFMRADGCNALRGRSCGRACGALLASGRASNLGPLVFTCRPPRLIASRRIAVAKERTTMIATGDFQDEVAERIKVIRAEAELTDSQFDKEKAEERVAKLGGAIGRIKVCQRLAPPASVTHEEEQRSAPADATFGSDSCDRTAALAAGWRGDGDGA
eukprot:scaffold121420_cov28-Tisochrysis_lutea.AAC.2